MVETATALISNLPNGLETTNQGSAGNRGNADESAPALAFGFSLQTALIALEENAAQSLQTFGAAPQENALPSVNQENSQTGRQNTQQTATPNQNAELSDTANSRLSQSTNRTAGTNAHAPQQTTLPAQQTTVSPTIAAPIAVQTPVTAAAPTPPPAPSTTNNTAAPNLTATRTSTNRAALTQGARPAPQAQAAPTAEFAQVLARRLDTGSSQFEIRLDPPALGRVEAQLRTSDDGNNLLALRFDNQEALDLFSRDQQALRNVLSAVGFELGNEQLSFSLNTDQNDQNFSRNENTNAQGNALAELHNAFAEPLLAQVSSRLIDIQI